MKKYSEFINFPIYLWASKEVDVEVPADEDDSSDEEEKRMSYSLDELLISLTISVVYITSLITMNDLSSRSYRG